MKIRLRLELLNLALHKVGGRGGGAMNLGGLVHSVGISLGMEPAPWEGGGNAPDRGRAVPLEQQPQMKRALQE